MKKLAALAVAGVLGIALGISYAAAFQFPWSSSNWPRNIAKPSSAQIIDQSKGPAPAGAPEPNERAVAMASWAPLIKRVMPTVVNVAVTQEARTTEFGGVGQAPGDEGGSNGPVCVTTRAKRYSPPHRFLSS